MDITSVVCGVNNTCWWVTCVGGNPITVARELTSWSIWHLAKYLRSWLLSTLESNFGASSTMACGGGPGSEWHFSWHQWWCLLWPFPLSLQLQSLWTQVPCWRISHCWLLRYKDAGHNSPSKYIHTSHHSTSHHITSHHITTQQSTSISRHCMHDSTHTQPQHYESTLKHEHHHTTATVQTCFRSCILVARSVEENSFTTRGHNLDLVLVIAFQPLSNLWFVCSENVMLLKLQ